MSGVEIPGWYRLGIATGLARLLSLQLAKAPNPGDMAGMTETWIEATWSAEKRRPLAEPWGAELMAAAFTELCAESKWWPAPVDWVRLVNDQRLPLLALPAPERQPVTADQRQRAAAKFREFRTRLELRT
jgi:hypothetical protein